MKKLGEKLVVRVYLHDRGGTRNQRRRHLLRPRPRRCQFRHMRRTSATFAELWDIAQEMAKFLLEASGRMIKASLMLMRRAPSRAPRTFRLSSLLHVRLSYLE